MTPTTPDETPPDALCEVTPAQYPAPRACAHNRGATCHLRRPSLCRAQVVADLNDRPPINRGARP